MKCVRCGVGASVRLRRHRTSFCEKCYTLYFERQVERAIEEFDIFRKDENVLVAISGGKDSMSLWNVLLEKGYRVIALHIDLGIGQYSRSSREVVEKFAKEKGAELIVYDLKERHGKSLPTLIKERKKLVPCRICGTVKRYVMNRVALEHEMDCVVTAHTLDDCCAFLPASLLSWDLEQISRQDVLLDAGEGLVRKAKPLYRLTDEECRLYVMINNIPFVDEKCPYSRGALSIQLKNIFNQLEKRIPSVKQQFYFGFLRRGKKAFQKNIEEASLVPCRICGMPTIKGRDVCFFCTLMQGKGG